MVKCERCEGELTPVITWVHEGKPASRHHPEVPADAVYRIPPNLVKNTYLAAEAALTD